MAGPGRGNGKGSPKPHAERTAATRAAGSASAGQPSRGGRASREEQRAPASAAPAGRNAPEATPTSAQPQQGPVTRSRKSYIEMPARSTKLLVKDEAISALKAASKKRKPVTKTKKATLAPTTATVLRSGTVVQSPTPTTRHGSGSGTVLQSPTKTTRNGSGGGISVEPRNTGLHSASASGSGGVISVEPRNTRLRSASASTSGSGGGGGLACGDCHAPAKHTVHLCKDCFNSRASCRSCRPRRH